MDEKNSMAESGGYQYLIQKFGKEKVTSRFEFVNKILQQYILQNQYESRVSVCQNIVEHIVIDYFVDIDRLKEFQEIELVNEIKIYSYLSYWILRHKPLQIIACDGQDDLVFVNEECVADFLCSFLFTKPDNIPFIAEQKPQIDEFVKTLRYHLAYRSYSAQNIELMLLAFNAGRGYQYSVDYQR
ncbi:MAG: hypothetical protein K1W20_05490 [Lachnospiraceae bacterium]